MDKELSWYRQEIEKRFEKSELKNWTIAANVKESYKREVKELQKQEKQHARVLKKQASQPLLHKMRKNEIIQQLQELAENYGQQMQQYAQNYNQ